MCGYESMYKNFQPELFPLSDNTNDLEFVLRSRLYIKKKSSLKLVIDALSLSENLQTTKKFKKKNQYFIWN